MLSAELEREHVHAFADARLTDTARLRALRDLVDRAINESWTLERFRRELIDGTLV